MEIEKIKPNRQGATEYVRLSKLPDEQIDDLLGWLPESYLTKVKKGKKLLNDCIEYDDYEFWYENCYHTGKDAFEEEL